MYGSIPLPPGATVTGMRVGIRDSNAGQNATVELERATATGTLEPIGSVTTSGSGGFQSGLEATVTPTVIGEGEHLQVTFDQPVAGATMVLCSVEVTYTLP